MLESLKNGFLNPPDEFTPIPFWFWNGDLTEQEIIRQIHDFNEKGVKGFVIHPRIGIPREIEYLSDRFMELVTCGVLEAEKLSMKVVLYDEAMYPSGSAHGMVVKNNPEYASIGLKMTEYQCRGQLKITLTEREKDKLVSVQAVKKVSGKEIIPESITKLQVNDNEINFTAEEADWSVLLFAETFTKGHIRGIHFGEDDGEKEAPASADLLNISAVEEFIKLTHERYYKVLKKYFGKTIIGMFTDEPDIMGRGFEKGLIPWTGGFLKYYIQQGNAEFDLPLLWFDVFKTSDLKRKRYQEAVNKRMEETYYKPVYEWCSRHNIALTGHPHESDDIGFLKYFHIPAQDIVWRWVAPENNLALKGQHSTMAKCTADSARHRGKRRNGNECFACCGKNKVEWAFSADDMKWYMDWLFVRGVNLLYPHAFFYSVDGPGRIGERPPDVGPNNIWWPYYKQISNYIKRMCYLMTDSVNLAKVAVLCEAHHLPWQIVKPLYENQIEFNYLEKELFLSGNCFIQESCIRIEKQAYRILVIEDDKLIDNAIMDKISTFIHNGGSVIVYNPDKTDLKIQKMISIPHFYDIVEKIDAVIGREVAVLKEVKDLRVTHIVKNGFEFFVFVNEGEKEINTLVRLKPAGNVGNIEKWDALRGDIKEAALIRKAEVDYMDIGLKLSRRESLILRVKGEESPELSNCPTKIAVKEKMNLDNDWYMGADLDNLEKISKLIPWNTIRGMEHFSGGVTYKTQFFIKEDPQNKKAEINLGEVYEIARVFLNGQDLGVQMWSPYLFQATDFIRKGENILIVEVKNTLANEICGLSLKSGLIGPVSLSFSG
ncbi:glycosylhydrolase-like jelly roll fold domain-containing protein [Anaerocolumna sp. MB42-C2]|uniref:glycosylhydrolase-like jelly roll fold domain-containing protein n=1 Tax=Anaerocolumna sp. MB42-C2 TaxID=3070997 RepID=UPI0027DF4B58|nr:glycosyl hydrolase [Anaerocolumna sp. MB42-C2]WMJ86530.1 glycosyl hydrolase [Anaerocolumna sp. MB42-C2]